jgi:transcriptional regulator with XRE-family HTH domain
MVNRLISARQCEAARAWLRWTREELANASRVSVRTISRFETEQTVPGDRTLSDLANAFAIAGIEFLFDGSRAVGLRLKA